MVGAAEPESLEGHRDHRKKKMVQKSFTAKLQKSSKKVVGLMSSGPLRLSFLQPAGWLRSKAK
jgi:hypothetical protein